MSKLRSVIRHEYLTIVKQPSFWIVLIAIPALIGAIIGLTALGEASSAQRIEALSKDLKNVAIVDKSGLINTEVIKGGGFTLSPSEQADSLREQVRTGEKE